MQITKRDVVAFLSGLSPMEMSALVKELEQTWQVKATPTSVAIPPPEPIVPVVPTAFDVVLRGAGEQRLAVVRVLRREVPGLDLRAARDLVDALPATVAEELDAQAADAIAQALREAGADVEIVGR